MHFIREQAAQRELMFEMIRTAREHLKAVWLKAVGRASHVDDRDEILSYRGAVICLVVGLVGMFVWLVELGLPALAAGADKDPEAPPNRAGPSEQPNRPSFSPPPAPIEPPESFGLRVSCAASRSRLSNAN